MPSNNSIYNYYNSINQIHIEQNNLIKKTEQTLSVFKKGIFNLEIKTKFKLYKNYTLKDYSRIENYDNYSFYEVEMTFKQIMKPQTIFENTESKFTKTIKSR